MRALALHEDVLVVTSAVLQLNCVVVRGGVDSDAENPVKVIEPGEPPQSLAESFVIDSPALPDELDTLPAILQQARFPDPSGLLATHGDWDHLLARLAFPRAALGCAESTAERLRLNPGEAQRELRAFDEHLMLNRARPLTLGSVQALPVPGRCDLGDRELELHAAEGHTGDGMAVAIPWAGVLVAGDYLSTVELPSLGHGGDIEAYIATLERLRRLIAGVEHVVPGHGSILERDEADAVLDEDLVYLRSLGEQGADAELPTARRRPADRRLHERNVAVVKATRRR